MKTLQNYLIKFIYASTNRLSKQNYALNIANVCRQIIPNTCISWTNTFNSKHTGICSGCIAT